MSEITLYQAEWCPHSHRARFQLTVHGVSYRTVNVPANRDDREELEAVSGQRSIPTLIIDDEVYTEGVAIARVIAERFPQDQESIGEHEQHGAPVAIARLDSGDLDAIVERLGSAFGADGFSVVPLDSLAGDGERMLALTNEVLYTQLVEIEPRLRALLPLHVAIYPHANGAVAVVPLPNQLWMHFHNRELSKLAYDLNQQFLGALERVGDRSGVA
jgi:glutaredoxin